MRKLYICIGVNGSGVTSYVQSQLKDGTESIVVPDIQAIKVFENDTDVLYIDNDNLKRSARAGLYKERCIVKITPIHETVEAVKNGYEIVHTFDVYEKYEKPLVAAGWDVIVFVPSLEEDEDRITCGNSLIALENSKKKEN